MKLTPYSPLLFLTAALSCMPATTQSQLRMAPDPTPKPAERAGQPPVELDPYEAFWHRVRDRPGGIRSLQKDELPELLAFFPDPPVEGFGSNVMAYLHEEGFEEVTLLEPFAFVDKYGHDEFFQMAYSRSGRLYLLEPPLIEGVLPADNYLAEIGGLFFEVLAPDGESWRFTIREEQR